MTVRRWYTPWLFVLPAMVVFTATVIAPVAWSLSYSLYDWSGIGAKRFVALDNYVRMLHDPIFRTAVKNNVLFALIGTTVQIVIGMLLAMLLLSITRFRDLVRVVYFIPCVISSVAISQIFMQVLSADPEGIVNGFFGAVGLDQLKGAYLANPNLTLAIVALVDAYKFSAIYMIIYLAAFLAIDKDLLDAAALDGANWWQQYVWIRFPLIKAVVLVTVVLLVSGTLKAFDVPYILTKGGPGSSSELVATDMYKTIFSSARFGYGSAMAVFLVAECLAIVAILRHVFRTEAVSA